jgi:hypothetical protein
VGEEMNKQPAAVSKIMNFWMGENAEFFYAQLKKYWLVQRASTELNSVQ